MQLENLTIPHNRIELLVSLSSTESFSPFYHCLVFVAYLDCMVRQYGKWPMRRLDSVQVCEIT